MPITTNQERGRSAIDNSATADLARMQPHDRVVTLGADKSGFGSIVRAAMLVILHALGEWKTAADALAVEVAVEVEPLSAVLRPRLAAKGLLQTCGQDFGFKLLQMFAGHVLG
jgi:hypothetical protein